MILNLAVIYIYVFFIFLFLTSLNKNKIERDIFKKMLIFLLISFSILAYYTEAVSWEGDDLGRYFIAMDSYRGENLKEVLKKGLWRETPLATIEMYFFSLLNNNHLLPAFNIIVIWGIYFYIVYREISEEKYISLRKTFYIILGLMSVVNLYESISNIRYPLAAAIIVFAVYLEAHIKKIFSILFYVMACLIHVAMIPLVVVRLILIIPFFRKNQWLILTIIAIFFGSISTWLLSSNNDFLQYLGGKVEVYSGQAFYGRLYFLGNLAKLAGVILIAISSDYKYKYAMKQQEKRQEKYSDDIIKAFSLLSGIFCFFISAFSFRMIPIIYAITIPKLHYDNDNIFMKFGLFSLTIGMIIGFYYNYTNYYTTWLFSV